MKDLRAMEGIWCVGAGAVGGTLAARLARAGLRPIVVDANREHVARLRDPGILVEGDHAEPTPLDALTPEEVAGRDDPCRLLLLAVRSELTETALEVLQERLDGDVVSVQNGLNEQRIAAAVGVDRVIGCVVGFAATWISPGRIALTTPGPLVIGRLDGSEDEGLKAAAGTLSQAVETTLSHDIQAALWGKLLINSVTVLGAVGGVLTGAILDPANRQVVCQVIAEGVDIAAASGVGLPNVLGVETARIAERSPGWDHELGTVLDAVAPQFADVKSVTLRDFERGHPIEIDAVTGELRRRARQHGVPAPVTEAVYDLLRDIEAGRRQPGPGNLALLADIADR